MTLTLGNGTNGLFDVLGKAFFALDTLNTARLTTVPAEVEDFLEIFKAISGADLDLQQTMQNVAGAAQSWQAGGNGLSATIASACANYLIEIVGDDADQPDDSLDTALTYLVDQMEDDGHYVDSSAVSIAVAANSNNIGDLEILYTEKGGDGQTLQNCIGEAIDIDVIDDSSDTTPTLEFRGEEAAPSMLSYKWPMGSGVVLSLAATDPAVSLLTNGDFEDTTIANTPDGWVIFIGTPGTTVLVHDAAEQTVVISGTPTGGSYSLQWENADGIVRSAGELAHDATSSDVQTALRTIPGLENVTVSSTGTSPDLTHTVVFTGMGGAVNAITSESNLTGGTPLVTITATVPGNSGHYKGRSLCMETHWSEKTELYAPLTLDEETVYFCHLRVGRRNAEEQSSSSSSSGTSSSSQSSGSSTSSSSSTSVSTSSSLSTSLSSTSSTTSVSSASSTSSSSSSRSSSTSTSSSTSISESSPSSSTSSSSEKESELRVEIVDGIEGNVTTDKAGIPNVLRINLEDISLTAHDSKWFAFRLKRETTQPVYLRLRITAPLPVFDAVYIDEIAVMAGTELYTGGPFVAAVSGKTAAVVEDEWTMTVTHDRAGSLQEWFNRAFAMADKGLLLPVSGTGTAHTDAVIS